MPVVPHYPEDEPDDPQRAPSINEIVDEILDGGDTPTPPSAPA